MLVASPHRFLRPDKLAWRGGAYQNVLDVLEAVGRICANRGVSARFVASETLNKVPKSTQLVLSHHTVDGPVFARLRAMGTIVRHFKTGDLPGTTIVDPLGFSGWSSLSGKSLDDLGLGSIGQADADAFYDAQRNTILQARITKYVQGDARPEPLPDNFVLIALQLQGDMVQRLAHMPMLDMLWAVCDAYRESGVAVLVKRHPKCKSRQVGSAVARVQRAFSHVRSTDAHIHDLLARARALFTVNSGVGSEAILHGCPIYVFGRSDYDPIAHRVTSAEALSRHLPERPAVSPADLRRFHYYYRNHYQAPDPGTVASRIATLLETGHG